MIRALDSTESRRRSSHLEKNVKTLSARLAFFSLLAGATGIGFAPILVRLSEVGLGHLPASFSSVSLLWQPAVAAPLAWLILKEPISLAQGIGGVVVLGGILLARGNGQRKAIDP